ncbi:hypothetical protein PNA2_1687 [Pyrococcus sp. NA2]|uniref:hypothetical protein n=1 Tax=Pyrococcus sp. (strain NA2) TaxID=342949 RepID=UPI000209AAA8|nr:hypothetical protein [Pyrococcus sp. NA2]AEC52602.1 hypothetical protein PNA2_1687 [Pyrococcus sp. NA2]
MWDIIRITYRELHYRMLRENVNLTKDRKKFESSLKWQGDIKYAVGLSSLAYFFFGFMIGISIYSVPRELRGIVFASNLIVPFIYAIYTTSLMVAYLKSGGVFEPLKPLPIPRLGFIISLLILIDVLPGFFLLLPSVLFLGGITPRILGLAWLTLAILMGHSLALLFQVKFGGTTIGKGSLIKNLAKAFGVLLIIGMFLVIQALTRFVAENVEKLAPIFLEYEIAFPMSASTVYDTYRSLILLTIYGVPFGILYIYGIKELWKSLEEEKVTGEVKLEYSIKPRKLPFALVEKDMKMIFRRTQLLGAFLSPVYISLWWIYMVGKEGFPLRQTTLLMSVIGIFSTFALDAIFRLEIEGFETLRTLPITKREFLLAKGIGMSIIPMVMEIMILALATIFNGSGALFLAPLIFTPLLNSGISIRYIKRKIKDVDMPNFTFLDGILILILNAIPVVIISIPTFFLAEPYNYLVVDAIVLSAGILVWRW